MDISRYTIKTEYEKSENGNHKPVHKIVEGSKPNKKPATIIELNPYNALNEFEHETDK